MKNNIYEEKSINGLIFYFSIPAILSLIVEILASVVDTAFAGHLGELSVDALTTMGLLTPILNLFTAIQSLFAVSSSIFIAKFLNQESERNKYFQSGIIMTILLSCLLSLAVFLSLDKILALLSAEGQISVFLRSYLLVQLFSNIFSAIGYTLTSCIRAFGYPKIEMIFTSLAVLVNIIFNAVFVYGFDLGFVGLAYGTLVSEIFCAICSLVWLFRHKLLPSFKIISPKSLIYCSLNLAKLGVAQAIIQAMGGCTGFFVNNSLMQHSGSDYVAVWNVVQNIYTLFLMPTVGITQGVQTIIAYFSGQGEEIKKKKAIKSTFLGTIVYGFIGAMCIFLFGKNILSIFASSNSILTLARIVLRIVFVTFPLMGIFYTIMTLFEVTGHELKAVALILTRQLFLIIPLVYSLPNLLPNLSISIFLSIPISDLLALIISLILASRNKNKPCSPTA